MDRRDGLTTEGLLLPGEEVEAAAARGLVAVVAQLPALPHLVDRVTTAQEERAPTSELHVKHWPLSNFS